MFLFKKKVTLADTNSKEEVEKKAELLKEAGIRSHIWATESQPVIGCGAHMKPADWSGKKPENKDDQRIIWHLEVAQEDQYKAMKLLMGENAWQGENFIR